MRRLLALAAFLLAALPASAQVYQIGDSLPFAAAYTSSNVGQTGLTITVDVYRDGTEVITGASATDAGDGIYTYTADGATYVTAAGKYVAVFHNGSSQDIYLAYDVTPAAANLDAAVSSIPTAAGNADAVLEELVGDHSATTGSTAAYLARIGSATITVTGPVNTTGSVTLYEGADEPQIDFDNTDGTWPDLTGATVTFYMRGYSKVMTVVTPTGSQKIRLAVTDTEADGFAPGSHSYQIWAVLSDSQERVLQTGTVTVRADERQ